MGIWKARVGSLNQGVDAGLYVTSGGQYSQVPGDNFQFCPRKELTRGVETVISLCNVAP